jgi:imidazoleglycerol-phosphate dehydratase
MEEALARVVLDLSGRYSLNFVELQKTQGEAEGYNFEDAKHFLQAFARTGGINLSIGIPSGKDIHHMLEAVFKALGRALDEATTLDPRIKGVPSTKGKL